MSITIERVLAPTDHGVEALLRHSGQSLRAEVSASPETATAVIGQSLMVELEFRAVLTWRAVHGEPKPAHGIFQAGDVCGSARIVGDVHNVLPLEDGTVLFDVYVRAGPEFVTFDSGDLTGQPPELHDLLEVVVQGLCFYPTWP